MLLITFNRKRVQRHIVENDNKLLGNQFINFGEEINHFWLVVKKMLAWLRASLLAEPKSAWSSHPYLLNICCFVILNILQFRNCLSFQMKAKWTLYRILTALCPRTCKKRKYKSKRTFGLRDKTPKRQSSPSSDKQRPAGRLLTSGLRSLKVPSLSRSY